MSALGVFKIASDGNSRLSDIPEIRYVEPIVGKSVNAGDYYNLIVGFYNETLSLLAPGELGCTLSHLNIYKIITSSKEGAIVLESDVTISTEGFSLIKDVVDNNNIDFIHLGVHPDMHYQRSHLLKATKIKSLYEISLHRPLFGTYAYFISNKLAEELLIFHEKACRRADCWQEFFASKNIFSVYYMPIVVHPEQRGSIHLERSKVKSKSILHISPIFLVNRIKSYALKLYAVLLGFRKIENLRIIE